MHLQGLDAYAQAMTLLETGLLVGFHAKAYGVPVAKGILPSQEEAMDNHVPVDRDASGYNRFLANLGSYLPDLNRRIQEMDGPGFFATLEPHVAGAGQNRGHSKPDGMGHAERGLTGMLDANQIGYAQDTFEDFRKRL